MCNYVAVIYLTVVNSYDLWIILDVIFISVGVGFGLLFLCSITLINAIWIYRVICGCGNS